MYENPNRYSLVFPLFDFGGSAGTLTIGFKGPKGKGGTLIDYGVTNIQETFGGGASATISVGILGGDLDAYGEELALPAAAATTAGSYTLRSLYDPIADSTSFDALLVGAAIPANTVLALTCVEATSTPTGQACPFCVIDWAW